MKINFVYPNIGTELRIPLALSILIAKLRQLGHEVKLFDPTFMGEFHTDNESMAKLGTHQSTNFNILSNNLDPKIELLSLVNNWKPDLICVSLVERNFYTAKNLLKGIDVPVLAGGIMATIAPEFCLKEDWIDHICVGEGEEVISELVYGKPSKPRLSDLNEIPEQDWTDFDDRHLLKPFMGRIYRGGSFEFSRGCFKSCSFCVAPALRKCMGGKYHRTKHPEVIIKEIEHKLDKYGLQMLSFGDTDFLSGVPKLIIKELLEKYIERVNLPFTIQTSVPTLLDEDILKLLRKAKCCAISVGVESGSERIRKDIMKKHLSEEMIKKAFDLCRKHELRVTANYMVGLPTETEEDVRQTMKLNRVVNPPSLAVTFFTPFIGTELYDKCIKAGYYKPFRENVYDYPPLDMPQLKPDRIRELVKEFTEDFKTYQKDICIL